MVSPRFPLARNGVKYNFQFFIGPICNSSHFFCGEQMTIASGGAAMIRKMYAKWNTMIRRFWAMVASANDLLHRRRQLHRRMNYQRKIEPIHPIYPLRSQTSEVFYVIRVKVYWLWETRNFRSANRNSLAAHGFASVFPEMVRISQSLLLFLFIQMNSFQTRLERESRGGDGNESNYSSNTSLTNASSSSYLLPSFACKRRITGKNVHAE